MLRLIRRCHRRAFGFTLIELLVVLAILGLLAIIAVPQVLKYLSAAKTDTAGIQITQLGATLDLYRLDVGRYPTQEHGLEALLQRPADAENWNGPYVRKRDMLNDPWDSMFIYRYPGEHGEYDLFSLGADEKEGGEGEDTDVVSW
ncbi:MAG: type II secretion system major pseudopilin GspG [Alphaproteobacteria bacterium]